MSTRLGIGLGLALASALGIWWLAASRAAIAGGGDAAPLALQLLFVLAVSRAMLVALVAPQFAVLGGYRPALQVALPVVTVAWPLVAFAWTASDASLLRTLATEALLVALAVGAPLPGRALARVMKPGPALAAVATAAGVVAALALWWLFAQGA